MGHPTQEGKYVHVAFPFGLAVSAGQLWVRKRVQRPRGGLAELGFRSFVGGLYVRCSSTRS